MTEFLAGKRILIVDDESDVLESLVELLDSCIIDTAPNFDAARKFLQHNTYDAAIIDIMGVNGYELLALVREKGIPALMLTAHALSPDHLVKSLKEGAYCYLPKFEMADIASYLADMLQAHKDNAPRSGKWFEKVRMLFSEKFGSNWGEEHEEFWKEHDLKEPLTRTEAKKIL